MLRNANLRSSIPLLSLLSLLLLLFASPGGASASPGAEGAASAPALDPPFGRLSLLGHTTLPLGSRVDGTLVGGLSGLAWDTERRVLWAVSDDAGTEPGRGPCRLYRLALEIDEGAGTRGAPPRISLRAQEAVFLRETDGTPLAPGSADPEGIALTPDGTLLVSSEGDAEEGIPPWVREVSPDGRTLRRFPLPEDYRPRLSGDGEQIVHGVRDNQGFEALTLPPGSGSVITATESALVQDGPEATLERGSPARILVMDLATGAPVAEHLYLTDPVAEPSVPPGELQVAGLVELLALDRQTLLALERSYSKGAGTTVRLYGVSLEGATDLLAGDRPTDLKAARPATKRLLLDLGELGLRLDNLEGLSWGPPLEDGRRTLLVISDDNFNPAEQVTQLLVFALSAGAPPIARVQGRGHRSPFAGDRVWGVEGVVTAVQRPHPTEGGVAGYWLQTPTGADGVEGDGDPATSEALFVRAGDGATGALAVRGVRPGDRLAVAGRVTEAGRPGQLTVTTLEEDPAWRRPLARGERLPQAVPVGAGGARPPSVVVDDDALELFDPTTDGADFWESLEGMRVEVAQPVVVGPTAFHGGFTVVADAPEVGPRTAAGGVLLRPGDANPERLQVELRRGIEGPATEIPESAAPPLDVGDRFAGPLVGVVDYAFSTYRLIPTAPLPAVLPAPEAPPSRTAPPHPLPPGDAEHLTVATWNLWNLDPGDGPERFRRMADRIVGELGSPDVLAVQEVQDASGPEDDGVVDGGPTFRRLVEAVVAAGGPRYDFRQIDPLDGLEGGQPGGNIRVGVLFDPRRVGFPDRGRPDALIPVELEAGAGGAPRLVPNPGRLGPSDPAFAGDRARDFSRSRRPLGVELEVAGRPLYLVDVHFRSKGGDDRIFGPVQPLRHRSEDQRNQQADRVAELVEEILRHDPTAAVVVLGDLNEHEFRSPLRRLEAAGLVNLVLRVPEEERYTYVFQGNSQVLDHVLVSPSLAQGAEVEILHLDADRAVAERLSDHDPVWARLPIGPASGSGGSGEGPGPDDLQP